jgi:tetratricopeptide (TPR) repeat protein
VEAWNALGLVFWRRGQLLDARAAFGAANARSANAASLRHLSGVTRALAQGALSESHDAAHMARLMLLARPSAACKTATDRLTLSAESVAHAKAALALALADGSSWYCLAMAHLAHAFVAGGGAAEAMTPVLKAFAQAERCGEAARNPDFHFNRGVALRYLEDFQGAADSFTAAGQLDDTLPWRQQLDSLVDDVSRAHDLVEARGRQKPKRVAAAAAAAAATAPPVGFTSATLSALVAGTNADKALACRLLATASAQGAVPVVHVAVDAAGDCFALSLFGLREGAAREGVSVVVVAPHLSSAQLRAGCRSLGYPLVRVHGAAGLLSGGAHPNAHAELPVLSARRS